MPTAKSADGVLHNFPDGTAPEVIDKVMKDYASQQSPSWLGEMGKAVGRGVTGFAGDIGEQLTGKNLREHVSDLGAAMTGGGPSKITPPYSEQMQKAAGLEESPQASTGQKIVGGGVEALSNPMSWVGPGGPLGKAATGFLSGAGGEVGKEVAGAPGQLAGAIIGGKIPSGLAKTAVPKPMSQERQAAVQILRNEGIGAETAGQTTGSKATQYWENMLGDAPGAGGKATKSQEKVGRQFTSAALNRAGINADLATPDVIDGAFTHIGGQMDVIAARNNARMDSQFMREMMAAQDEYHSTVQQGSKRAVVDKTITDLMTRLQQSPVLSGDQYQSFRSRLMRFQRGAAADPEYSQVLGDYVEAMDGMMSRSITNRADWTAWQEARRQYRNLIPLANASIGAGEQAAEGIISPARLRQALTNTQRGKRDYARGRGDFADAAA